ncbi:LysR family transcriptional regulator [Burkholderia pseudomallei]|uniref:LysR family transcriptional regulator n=1 Tax=Burkholderia pseudomallei TaxID=28450 RepID=UPI0001A488B8|nr:LysR family transcriptional regulator [Burkholderia pseudomallei]ACQ96842.1 transcriptional regulator, LysR family [Burkholderia pseudomallei MSHR346]AIP10219.1 bacterial regulatory helix-turn-helix, lysR family protein [Burkholderia pseudomallei]
MDRWAEYEFFVRVVEMGSLSKAAEALSISTPSASRLLATLEKRLDARLIERSTRRLSVTEVGLTFYARCKTVLDEMNEAEEAAAQTSRSPSGVLRVTASLSLMLQHVATLLPDFTQRYPNVQVELVAANRYYDITDNDIDVAIRTREDEPDSTLIIRRLATTRRVLAASPAYIQRHGMPAVPQALPKHKFLGYSYHNPRELTFQRDGESISIPLTPLLDANDGQIVRVAALDGLGILAQPMYVIYDDVMAGRLIPLLLDWELPRLSINLVYRRRALIPAKTRVFLDFILEDFQAKGYEQRWESASTTTVSSQAQLNRTTRGQKRSST